MPNLISWQRLAHKKLIPERVLHSQTEASRPSFEPLKRDFADWPAMAYSEGYGLGNLDEVSC